MVRMREQFPTPFLSRVSRDAFERSKWLEFPIFRSHLPSAATKWFTLCVERNLTGYQQCGF